MVSSLHGGTVPPEMMGCVLLISVSAVQNTVPDAQ